MKLLGVRAGAGPGLNQGFCPKPSALLGVHSIFPEFSPLSGFGVSPTLYRSHRPVAEAPEVPSRGPVPRALTPASCPPPPPAWHRYLYLLFSEDDMLSLEDWVFNTEAHPLPVNHSDGAGRAGGQL